VSLRPDERFSDDGDDNTTDGRSSRHSRDYDDYDSGVNTDMSLVTVAPSSPTPFPLKRSASTKILQIINILQQEAFKYDLVLILILFLTLPILFLLLHESLHALTLKNFFSSSEKCVYHAFGTSMMHTL